MSDDEISRCRSCGAPIHWARTDSGKLMPVNAEPDALGNLLLWRAAGELHVVVRVNNGEGPRYRPHFATCPHAKEWRRDR